MAYQTDISDDKEFVIIKLDEEYVAIDISYVGSIIYMGKITRVPKAQPYYKGIINLRGEIIPVMSLKKRLGLEEGEYDESTRIVIIKAESKSSVGLIVDNVYEIISFDKNKIEKSITDNEDKNNMYVYGIGKYENKLVSLLDLPKLILE